jgi:hypothetical protein
MPKQTPKGVDPDNIIALAKTTSIIILAVLIIQLIYDTCTKSSYDSLFTLFFSMQIACYLKIYSTPFPVSAEIFMDEFTKVIEFYLIDPEVLIQQFYPRFSLKDALFGTHSNNNKVLSKDVKASIFDDMHMYILLITTALCLYFVMAIIAKILPFCKNRIQDRVDVIKKALFFNLLIRIITVSYIQLTMTTGVQMTMWFRDSGFQTFNERILAGVMACFVVFAPFVILLYLKKRRLYLYQKSLKERIGVLYSGIHLFRDSRNLYYYPIFLIRRFWFVALPSFLFRFPFAQLQCLVFMSSLYVAFYASARPHEERFRVRLEIFNECLIMILNYHMLLFSGFTLAKDYTFYLGYTFVITAATMTFTNLYFMVKKDMRTMKTHNRLTEKKANKAAAMIANQGSFLKKLMAEQKDALKAQAAEDELIKEEEAAASMFQAPQDADEKLSGRSRNSRRQIQSTSSRSLRKKTPLKPMTLEVIDEENSQMASMNDMSQRDATNPFEAMRALRKSELNAKANIEPDVMALPEGTMDESSQ